MSFSKRRNGPDLEMLSEKWRRHRAPPLLSLQHLLPPLLVSRELRGSPLVLDMETAIWSRFAEHVVPQVLSETSLETSVSERLLFSAGVLLIIITIKISQRLHRQG